MKGQRRKGQKEERGKGTKGQRGKVERRKGWGERMGGQGERGKQGKRGKVGFSLLPYLLIPLTLLTVRLLFCGFSIARFPASSKSQNN